MQPKQHQEAFVTLVTNDLYSRGACVLGQALRNHGTTRILVVMISPQVTNTPCALLESVFDYVVCVDILDSKDEAHLALLKRPELGVTFTKLHCWNLTDYDKCVFMDADTLPLANIDELFEREEFSAAPDAGWPDMFNSGVFVYRPSKKTYLALIDLAESLGSFDGGDQGLLNTYFSSWLTSDMGHHLPFVYNMHSTATYTYSPAFARFGKDTKVVHFVGSVKPWHHHYDPTSGVLKQTDGEGIHEETFIKAWWKTDRRSENKRDCYTSSSVESKDDDQQSMRVPSHVCSCQDESDHCLSKVDGALRQSASFPEERKQDHPLTLTLPSPRTSMENVIFFEVKETFVTDNAKKGDATEEKRLPTRKKVNDKQEIKMEETEKENTKKEETKKEETRKQETRKEETKKEETRKEETRKEETKKEETRKETNKEETKKEEINKQKAKKEESKKEKMKMEERDKEVTEKHLKRKQEAKAKGEKKEKTNKKETIEKKVKTEKGAKTETPSDAVRFELWQKGTTDFVGADSFAYIQAKIDKILSVEKKSVSLQHFQESKYPAVSFKAKAARKTHCVTKPNATKLSDIINVGNATIEETLYPVAFSTKSTSSVMMKPIKLQSLFGHVSCKSDIPVKVTVPLKVKGSNIKRTLGSISTPIEVTTPIEVEIPIDVKALKGELLRVVKALPVVEQHIEVKVPVNIAIEEKSSNTTKILTEIETPVELKTLLEIKIRLKISHIAAGYSSRIESPAETDDSKSFVSVI